MEKKMDFRIQRTYKMLMDALMDALREKDFDEITVSELCDRAMIRRATFYKHFGDKYELFAYAIRTLEIQFREKISRECEDDHSKTFYIAMADDVFRFVEENDDVFSSVMRGKSSKMLLEILSEELERDICQRLTENEKEGHTLPARPDLLAAILSGSLISILRWWNLNGKKMPREELTRECARLIRLI